MKTKAEKQVQLAEIKKLFAEAKGAVLVDFSGLTVAEDTELRRKVREAGASYTVYKNTLIALAAKEYGLDDLAPVLEKNTAICSSSQDAVAACKVMCDFVKDHKKMQLKAGVVEGKVVTVDEVKAVAALPPKEVLVAKMLGSLNAPISGLVRTLNGTVAKIVYALDAVREQKEKQSA
ncbi:MAG: 50S ribosomal protein L10 [Acidaminococcaceae bacterium]|nr:50S ribosomal protein L10 [Acidaminococcaceae bacterium]MEE3395754.1 50S ribosomal protein L10 [Succiniclasticum sp.]MBQ2343547.1 50S ribosomal protein L10 [Acidaminococcaceae bacterium]MBQ6423978.1 50S ribosomal protein L10 [Acidaminococcaceae bacterium]MBQ6429495.1 50S ribosomal protein L10 [Acidaminococcaceae bacterium]